MTVSGSEFVYLADHDPIDPGVRIFDAATGAPVDGPVPTGLGPIELHIWRPATSDVGGPGSPSEAAGFDGLPWPNPSSGRVSFSLAPSNGDVGAVQSLAIFDAAGALVRRLSPRASTWDGRDDADRLVPAGRYFLFARSERGDKDVRSIVIVR